MSRQREQHLSHRGGFAAERTPTISPDQYINDFTFPNGGGRPTPHLWTDPPMAKCYDADHSYLGLMRFDFATVVKNLGGDASLFDTFDTSDVAADKAECPQ